MNQFDASRMLLFVDNKNMFVKPIVPPFQVVEQNSRFSMLQDISYNIGRSKASSLVDHVHFCNIRIVALPWIQVDKKSIDCQGLDLDCPLQFSAIENIFFTPKRTNSGGNKTLNYGNVGAAWNGLALFLIKSEQIERLSEVRSEL